MLQLNISPLQVGATDDLIEKLVQFFLPEHSPLNVSDNELKVKDKFMTHPAHTSGHRKLVGSKLGKSVRKAANAIKHTTTNVKKLRGGAAPTSSSTPTIAEADSLPQPSSVGGSVQDVHSDLTEAHERAQDNITCKYMRLGEIRIFVSYKGGKRFNFEDFEGLQVKVHTLVYNNRTSSVKDILARVRRDIIFDLVTQVGRNFKNIGVFLRDKFIAFNWIWTRAGETMGDIVFEVTREGMVGNNMDDN